MSTIAINNFYSELLTEALQMMPDRCSMVIGPIFSGDVEENLKIFKTTINQLRSKGEVVFSQLEYLDNNFEDAPHDYDAKFPIFYKGLVEADNLEKIFVLPGWENSTGTKREIGYAQGRGVELVYL